MNTSNVNLALARLDRLGGRTLVAEILAAFRRQGPARAGEAGGACVRGDGAALARAAHSLKSSCGQLGADELAARCARLEELGLGGTLEGAAPLAAGLAAEVDSLIRDLETYLAHEPSPDPEVRRRRVGIVEDSEDTRIILRKMLEPYYEVDECTDGPAALERFTARPPDAVLLDISLPGMDGVEVLRRLRTIEGLSRTPMIALTAHAMVGDRETYLSLGFDEYVSKPILDELDLLRVIAGAMDRPHDA